MASKSSKEPVLLKKDEFLRAFESGELQRRIEDYLFGDSSTSPSESEQRAWNNSYAFLDIVLRDSDIPADVEVLCEYALEPDKDRFFSRRADAIILAPKVEGAKSRRAVVVELKQWDRFYLDWCSACKSHRSQQGNNLDDLGDPVEQANEYLGLFERFEDQGIIAQACVYLHNLDEDHARGFGICEKEGNPVRVFYHGWTERLGEFLSDAVSDGALMPLRAIKRAEADGYWGDNLPKSAAELYQQLANEGLVKKVDGQGFSYEPTSDGLKLGIARLDGYDASRQERFVSCAFADAAMRELAGRLSKE